MLLSSHSRLAAIALLVLDEEESAFWCLVAIVETIMPADYYSKTLLASQVSRSGRGLGATQVGTTELFLRANEFLNLHFSLCTVGQ